MTEAVARNIYFDPMLQLQPFFQTETSPWLIFNRDSYDYYQPPRVFIGIDINNTVGFLSPTPKMA